MMKLLVLLAVAGLALVSGGAVSNVYHELGPQQVQLHAGVGERSEVEVSPRSTLISNRIVNAVMQLLEDNLKGEGSLPPLDPLQASGLGPYTVGSSINVMYRFRGWLNSVDMRGVGGLDINNLVFSILRLNLNFHAVIPEIVLRADYSAEIRALLFLTHRATGILSLLIRRIDVNGHMQLSGAGGKLQTTRIDLDIDIGHTHINITEITGVGVIDLVLNYIIQNVSADVIQANREQLSQTISDQLFDTVNEVLGNFTLEDLLG